MAVDIAVINASTVLTDRAVKTALPALQTQIRRDFAPVWGIDADLRLVARNKKPPKGSWWLVLHDNAAKAGEEGYHDLTSEGLPLGKVFAETDLKEGDTWTVTTSHELLEMLADPDVNLSVMVEKRSGGSYHQLRYAYEVCDACEDDQFGYKIDGTLVSDFVYPAWFESFHSKEDSRFDQGRHLSRPLELLPGGYIAVYEIRSGRGWTQLDAKTGISTNGRSSRIGGRRERRRKPRHEWLKSDPA